MHKLLGKRVMFFGIAFYHFAILKVIKNQLHKGSKGQLVNYRNYTTFKSLKPAKL